MKKKTKLKEKVENGSVGESENGCEETATVITGEGRLEDECPGDANGFDSSRPSPPPCDESDYKSAENELEVVSNGHDGDEVVDVDVDVSAPAAEAIVENGSEEVNTNGISENGVEQGKLQLFCLNAGTLTKLEIYRNRSVLLQIKFLLPPKHHLLRERRLPRQHHRRLRLLRRPLQPQPPVRLGSGTSVRRPRHPRRNPLLRPNSTGAGMLEFQNSV